MTILAFLSDFQYTAPYAVSEALGGEASTTWRRIKSEV